MEKIEVPIPGFSSYNSKILNTHIVYGLVEALLRGGIRELTVSPQGEGYTIRADFTWPQVLEGIKSALEDMLSLHFAVGHRMKIKTGNRWFEATISNASFSNGVFLDPPQNVQRYPRELEAILEYLKRADFHSDKTLEELKSIKSFISQGRTKHLTVLEQLDPVVSKWIGFYSYNEDGRISRLEYALAWIGLHNYSTIYKISRKSSQMVVIVQYPPIEDVETWELLLLKDLSTKVVRDSEKYWDISIEYGLFRKLLEVSLPPSTAEILGLSKFSMSVYAQERSRAKGWRIYRQLELSPLWDFVSYLKITALYDLMMFVNILKCLESSKDNKKTIEDVLAQLGRGIYSAVVFNEVDEIYVPIRQIRRLGYSIPPRLMNAIIDYLMGGAQ